MVKMLGKKEVPLGVKVCAGIFFAFAGAAWVANFILTRWFSLDYQVLSYLIGVIVFSAIAIIVSIGLLKATSLSRKIGMILSGFLSFVLLFLLLNTLGVMIFLKPLLTLMGMLLGISMMFSFFNSVFNIFIAWLFFGLYFILSAFPFFYLLFSKKAKEYFN